MKRTILFAAVFAMAAASLWTPPATADEHEQKFKVTGEIRSRFEYAENMADLEDDPNESGVDDSFSFWPYRIRIGIDGQITDSIRAVVDLQNFGNFGSTPPNRGLSFDDPFDYYFGGGPDAPTYPGDPSFFAYPHLQSLPSAAGEDDINLYQGFIEIQKIAGSNIDARIGRQEMPYGTELLLGDNDFYSGLSFDGLRGAWMGEKASANAFYFKTQENNIFGGPLYNIRLPFFPAYVLGIDGTSNDTNLFGATFDWKLSETLGTVGGYYIGHQDLTFDSKLNTFGARWNKPVAQEQMFDWNLEVALQSGDFGEPIFGSPALDLSGDIVEGWFGFSIGDGIRHRFHVGGLIASGDDSDTDNESEAFTPLYGDIHAYGRLGYLDLFNATNITDFNVGYTLGLAEGRHQFGLAYHMFTLTEIFFDGQEDDLGDEIDAWWNWNLNKNFGIQAGIAQLAVGDAWGDDADDVLRGWAQARVTW